MSSKQSPARVREGEHEAPHRRKQRAPERGRVISICFALDARNEKLQRLFKIVGEVLGGIDNSWGGCRSRVISVVFRANLTVEAKFSA